jgi:type IV fimbrial biogenesis protein FimT
MNRVTDFALHAAGPQLGFTLVELVVTLGVAAILTAIAVPSFQYTTSSYRDSQQTGDLLADLQYARAQAIMQGQPVTVCISSGGSSCLTGSTGWQAGWIVFSDINNDQTLDASAGDVVKRTHAALNGNTTLTLAAGQTAVTFNRAGNVAGLPAAGLTFVLHDPTHSSGLTRCVVVSATGRAVAQNAGTGSCS